jgi:aspartyl protease family protein
MAACAREFAMRNVVLCFIFMAVFAIGLSRQFDVASKPENLATATTASRPSAAPPPVARTSRSVTLQSDRSGHFQTEVRIDGRRIDFMVDTGASMIAMRESSAARLGIFPKPSDYTVRTQTANGVGRAAPVMLNRVELNGINVRDVQAFVVPDEALSTNLLGMSFLSRVKWTHDRGRLVLEQ